MKKLILPFIVAISLNISSFGQTIAPVAPEKPVEVKISGFVLNNMFIDDRKNYDAIDGLVLLYPLPKVLDSMGVDMNKVPTATLLSLASRLKFNITGPDAFGAKTSGSIEFDFTARANCATVRFRQGWVKLNWSKTELLVGRAWSPFVVTDVLPSVITLGIGAPFQPFNRSDQITLTQKMGKLNLILSAMYQNDYTSSGPNATNNISEKSCSYQNHSLIPNLDAQLKLKTEHLIAGVGIDYKKLVPRTSVVSPTTKDISSTKASVNCPAFQVYAQLKVKKLTVAAKSIYSFNSSESLMTGAYGISVYDTVTGHESYVPYRHVFVWGNVSYGEKFKVSVFGGFLKNLGASENIVNPKSAKLPTTVYGMGENIGQMIRITPNVSYTSGKVMIALELEENFVSYGRIDYSDKGKIKDTSLIHGTRLLATMYYYF